MKSFLFLIILYFSLSGCGLVSHRKIKFKRVSHLKKQADSIKIVNSDNLKLTTLAPNKKNSNSIDIKQIKSKSLLNKNKSPLSQILLCNDNNQKVLTLKFLKRTPVFTASNHNNISTNISRIVSKKKKDDTIYQVFVGLGFLAMIALVITGLFTLSLGYPSGIAYLVLAGLILLTIILIEIIRNRQPRELNNDQIEKQSKFWRGFAAIIGVVAVIVITLLLI